MTKAIIFDCFGVLYLDHRKSLAMQYPEKAEELWEVNRQSDYGFLTRRDYLKAVSELTAMTTREIEIFVQDEHTLNKGLIAYIEQELKPQHKIGLLSNIGRGWIKDFFSEHQLHEIFDTVILSGEEGIAKPHPRIFELAATRLGCATYECVMIDDLESNCAGADAAGMPSVHFKDNHQLRRTLAKLIK